jgi:hypothetical protein
MKGENMIAASSCHAIIPWDSKLASLQKAQKAKKNEKKSDNTNKKEISWILVALILALCLPAMLCWRIELSGSDAKPRAKTV